MNHALAVDASVAVKWVIKEEHSERAWQLWTESFDTRRAVIVPPHCTGEVTSALYQRTRRTDPAHRLPLTIAGQALGRFLAFPLHTVSPPDLYVQAFDFALTYGMPSIYDCLYAVAAHLLDVVLWTADERLLIALAGRASWVRFIGDYPV